MNVKTILGLAALVLTGCPKTQKTVDTVSAAHPVAVMHTPATNQVIIAEYLLRTGEVHDKGFFCQTYYTQEGDFTWCYKEQGTPNNYADDVLVLEVGTLLTIIDDGLDGVVDYVKAPHTADRVPFASLPEQEQTFGSMQYTNFVSVFVSVYVKHLKSEGFQGGPQ